MARPWTAMVVSVCLLISSAHGEELTPTERVARVEKAEAEAKAAFERDHYFFVTPEGRVDPAEGGIPAFALGRRDWDAFRGARYVNERSLLLALGRSDDAREVRTRRILWGTVAGLATGVAAASAAPLEFWDETTGDTVLRGVGTLGGFGVGTLGLVQFQRKRTPIDELFIAVQKLNDQIRGNLRAQYRLIHGVPLEEPTRPSAPGTSPAAPE